MKFSIKHRLFIALLAAALLSVVSMLLIIQWNLDRGFLRYINNTDQTRIEKLATAMTTYYSNTGNWDCIRKDQTEMLKIMQSTMPEYTRRNPGQHRNRPHNSRGGNGEASGHRPPPDLVIQHFEMRVLLLDDNGDPVFGPLNIRDNCKMIPLNANGKLIGQLGLMPAKRLSDTHQMRFIREQKLSFAMIASVVFLLAAGLAFPLANRLIQPIKRLAAGTNRLAAGQFETRVIIDSSDELGQLAQDFNTLALTLEKNELARKQWVADISHELRTPLAILRGEIEALQDGIRQPSSDTIRSLHSEVMRLGRLIDDLYQLSLTDLGAMTYRKEPVDLILFLNEMIESYRPELDRCKINLFADLPTNENATLSADPARLQQLFTNLLDNSLKYTDPEGTLHISLTTDVQNAAIVIEDSAPGVPAADLPRLFERLYRVEASRNRSTGGAGLGLSICRNIVEAHNGSISAQTSPLGGLRIEIIFPLRG